MNYPEPVVGAFIRNKNGEFLFIESPKWKGYTIPGGHIEIGETMEAALRREVREEVGIGIKNIRFLAAQDGVFPPQFKYHKHFVYLHFVCDAANEDTCLDSREVSAIHWLSPVEALAIPLDTHISHSLGIAIQIFSQQ